VSWGSLNCGFARGRTAEDLSWKEEIDKRSEGRLRWEGCQFSLDSQLGKNFSGFLIQLLYTMQ